MEVKTETRKSAINHLAFGTIILLWGILLLLKQVGIIEKNVSTWPFAFVSFGALLVVSGIVKLNRSRRL
jgi:uncharacterized membrane protein